MAPFRTVTDKDYESDKLNAELSRLRKNGLVLPRHSGRAAQSYGEIVTQTRDIQKAAGVDLDNLAYSVGKTITSGNLHSPEVQSMVKENEAKMQAMGQKRDMSYRAQHAGGMRRMGSIRRTAASVTPGGTDAQNAIPRFYDPLEYWDLSGLPWNVADEGHRHKLHKWLRLYYATHYLVPTLIDIFTRFPLIGIELESKDAALKDIYEEIFLRNLKYDEFFVGLGREYWCALPDELIQGADGPIPIESVQAGDMVLTHKGVLKPVKGSSSREYSGKYVKLRPHYGLPMRYTYGHPFLVRRDEKTDWIPVEEITTTDELFVPVDQRIQDRTVVNIWETLQGWLQVPSESEIATWPIPEHITWTDSEITYRNWVRRTTKDLTPGDVWKRLGYGAQHSPLKSEIDLTDDLLWFFGLYLAEGAVTKDGVRISLHAKEIAYAERVVGIAADFGLNANISHGSSENSINVIVYSIAFGAWIDSLLGTGHNNKRIAEWMMILPAQRQIHLLRGYFDGDGHYGDVRVHAASASLLLALQVERMIRRQGVVTTINEANSTTVNGYFCRWWMVGPAIGDTRVFLERLGVSGEREFQKRQFGCWQGANEGYWVKVFQIDKTGEYTGPVYNIEVEDDHSYVGSVATHNCVGECFCLGSFDEDLGVWEHEELINPEDVVIDNFPFLNTQQLKIVPPDYLRRIAQTKSPAREWFLLQEQYADLIPYLLKGEHIPISPVMMRQVANKMNNWDDHGTPILLRGLRTLLYEEKLLASQEAIAERLYSPLILAKLGIMDMGEGLPPWIPTPAELESVRDDLDIALASDFRLMVHHFGLDITSVFGREQMPRLGDDFDRIERRIMQVFGVNPSLLSAGSNSQPYASSALQAEFMNQVLKTFQNQLKAHYRERALVVAEAQGHQDYEKRGQTRIPIYERVVVYDDEGNKEIKEVPKLIVPTLKFASFDLRDEATERQFLMELRQMGVPLPNADLLIGVDWKYKDKIDEYNTELKEQTIAQQQAKMETYYALTVKGLPVPLDLKAECESVLVHGPGSGGGAPQGATQGMGGAPGGPGAGAPPGGPGAGPGGEAIVMPPAPPGLGAGPGTAPPGGGPPPTNPMAPGPAGTVPQVSNERRPGLTYNTSNDGITRFSAKEGSDFDEYMADNPNLGLPFVDYIIDNHKFGSLAEVPRVDIEILSYDWPKHEATYMQSVANEIATKLASSPEVEKESAIVMEPEKEFVLKANQELQKTASGKEKIVETPSKTKVKFEQKKKYGIIDVLASDLSEDDKPSESTDTAEPKSP
jgi:intein/homing endonuclease